MGSFRNTVFYYPEPRRLELVQEDCPSPGPGQVRCRSVCSLVSIGTELTCFTGEVEPGSGWEAWIKYPFPPGYSSVGEVVDLGEGVTGLAAGDLVCSNSSHRQWFLDRPETMIPVPEGVSPREAAWFTLNTIVQNGIRETRPTLGEDAVVIGLGPLGQLAVRLLGLCGLNRLIAVDPSPVRCRLAEGRGPTRVLCCGAGEAEAQVAELTRGRGAHLVYDITGHPAVFHPALRMLGRRGRLGLIGDVAFPSRQSLTHDLISRSISIIGAHATTPPWQGNPYYPWGRREMNEFLFDLVLDHRIDLEEMITHTITPQEAPAAYRALLADREGVLGMVIDWTRL